MIQGLILALMAPIMVLNIIGGILGGIWLAFRGEWRLIIIGFIWAMISPWVLSVLMLPNLGIAMAVTRFLQKKWALYILGFISTSYTNFLVVVTCMGSMAFCLSRKYGGVDFSVIPYLLWAWGMGLGPWQYFASKERDNEFTGISLFFASILYFIVLMSVFFPPVLAALGVLLFWGGMVLALPIFNIWLVSRSVSMADAV